MHIHSIMNPPWNHYTYTLCTYVHIYFIIRRHGTYMPPWNQYAAVEPNICTPILYNTPPWNRYTYLHILHAHAYTYTALYTRQGTTVVHTCGLRSLCIHVYTVVNSPRAYTHACCILRTGAGGVHAGQVLLAMHAALLGRVQQPGIAAVPSPRAALACASGHTDVRS